MPSEFRKNLTKCLAFGSAVGKATAIKMTLTALKIYGKDMIEQVANFDPIIGRHEEIQSVIENLSRMLKSNAILVGEPGVGKTTIVEGLAQRIARGNVPKSFVDVRIIELDICALMVGIRCRGQFVERFKAVLKEVEDSEGKIILFIDDIHLVLGAGSAGGYMDATDLLKPVLVRGHVRCIGATTQEDYKKYIENNAALARRFQKITVSEPTIETMIRILRVLKERYESHHDIRILDQSLIAIAELSSRYVTGYLPSKAIDLLDQTCASVRVKPDDVEALSRNIMQLNVEAHEHEKKNEITSTTRLVEVRKEVQDLVEKLHLLNMKHDIEKEMVVECQQLKKKRENVLKLLACAEKSRDLAKIADLRYGALRELDSAIKLLDERIIENMMIPDVVCEHVAAVVSRSARIPVTRLDQDQRERLLGLAKRLQKRVIGQEQAVDAVANVVLSSKAGLGSSEKPTGSFLFLGSSGVGKTELAKALAEELSGDERFIIRINMYEYIEKQSVSRLIGSPLGYVGYEDVGQLTEAVRQRPSSVILFDGVENAHISVLNLLLQVLDEGRLTDGRGDLVDFRNTLIVLTSNLGAKHLLCDATGDSTMKDAREQVLVEVRSHFRPKLLNRLDQIVIFDPLSHEQLKKVATLHMNNVAAKLVDINVTLEMTDAALNYTMENSFDPVYGARAIKRWLDENVTTVLAKMNLKGKIYENSIVRIDDNGGELVYLVSRCGLPVSFETDISLC